MQVFLQNLSYNYSIFTSFTKYTIKHLLEITKQQVFKVKKPYLFFDLKITPVTFGPALIAIAAPI